MTPPFLLSGSGGEWTAWMLPEIETLGQTWTRLRSLDIEGCNWVWLKGGAVWPIHSLFPPLTPMADPGLPEACLGSRCPTCLWVRTNENRRCLCTLAQRCHRCGLPLGNPLEDLAGLQRSEFKPSPLFLGMSHRCVRWAQVKVRPIDSFHRT